MALSFKVKNCPLCKSKRIYLKNGPTSFKAGKKKVVIKELSYWYCPQCKEKLYPPETSRQIDRELHLKRLKKAA